MTFTRVVFTQFVDVHGKTESQPLFTLLSAILKMWRPSSYNYN